MCHIDSDWEGIKADIGSWRQPVMAGMWRSEEKKDKQWEERRECRTEVNVVAIHPPSSAETVEKYAVPGLGCTATVDSSQLSFIDQPMAHMPLSLETDGHQQQKI